MEYIIGGHHFSLNWDELVNDYHNYISMSDTEFMQNLVKAAHFACIVLYLKNGSAEMTVGDTGIIHQLIHLMDIPDEPLVDLQEIREQFKIALYLA